MELHFGIFILLELANLSLCCFLIINLYKKKDVFPYANVSPLWIITFISGKVFKNKFSCFIA